MNPPVYQVTAEGRLILARLLLGALSIGLAQIHFLFGAALTLVLCVWWDAGMGWFFRRLRAKSPGVAALENHADLICFVIAPMELTAALAVHVWLLLLLPVFLLAAVYRMARFNIEGVVNQSYRGLPVTYNGYWFPFAGLGVHAWPVAGDFLLGTLLLATSLLMVSRHLLIPEF